MAFVTVSSFSSLLLLSIQVRVTFYDRWMVTRVCPPAMLVPFSTRAVGPETRVCSHGDTPEPPPPPSSLSLALSLALALCRARLVVPSRCLSGREHACGAN